MMSRFRLAVAAIVTVAAAFLFMAPLDILPDLEQDVFDPFPIDMVVHVGLVALLVLLWSWALPRVPVVGMAAAVLVFAAAAELAQGLPFIERSPRWRDFGYNVVGAALGVVLAALMRLASKR